LVEIQKDTNDHAQYSYEPKANTRYFKISC